MAIAVETLPAAAAAAEGAEGAAGASREAGAWQGISRASGQLRRAPAAAGSSLRAANKVAGSPSAAAATVTKLIWAVAVGLIVLQIAAEATGQRWSFALPSAGRGPAPKQPYMPLYSGQTGVSAAAALPGVLGASGIVSAGTPGLKPNPGTGGI